MKLVQFCGNLLTQILDGNEAFLRMGNLWLLTPNITSAFSMWGFATPKCFWELCHSFSGKILNAPKNHGSHILFIYYIY